MDNYIEESIPVQQHATEEFTWRDMMALCLAKWQWFILSLFVFLSLATLYLLRTPPTYTRTSSILIKEEGTGRSASFTGQISQFSSMGMFNDRTNVNNEITTIQSPIVMEEVVRRLRLDINYTASGLFYDHVLYGSSLPIYVMFYGISDNDSFTFDVECKKDNSIKLCNFVLRNPKPGVKELKLDETYKAQLGDSIVTSFGAIRVMPAAEDPEYMEEIFQDKGNKVIHVSRNGYFSTMLGCIRKLKASLASKEATIVDMVYRDVSPKRAEDILNTVIAVYNENWVNEKNQVAVSTCKFIDERLKVIAQELGEVDNDIAGFKAAHRAPNFDEMATLALTQSNEAQKKLLEIENRLYTAEHIKEIVSNPNNKELLPAIDKLGGKAVEEYNTRLLMRNNLAENSGSNNSVVQEYDKALASLRQSVIDALDNEIIALNKEKRSFKNVELDVNSQLAANPQQAKHMLAISRQQQVKNAIYLYLLQRREESELSQTFTATNTRIVVPPMGSSSPSSPRRLHIMAIAFLLGLAIPTGLVYLLEILNTRIRGRKDIEKLTIPYIGEIPHYKFKPQEKPEEQKKKKRRHGKKSKRANDIYEVVVQDKSRNIINEAFRVVRTNLEFMLGNTNKSKVIISTSANPGSGKTFLTANMATSVGIKGKKVAILDLDLRRASISIYVNSPKVGISNYLTNQIPDWNDVMVKGHVHPNVDMIPVGTIPPNPTELLFSDKLEKLISDLREQYDFIFIDCPPVEIVADTSIIAKWSDLTIFVIRAGLMEREMLPTIQEFYDTKKYPNMAILLNGTEATGGRYGHRYGYRYGYNYGYGSYGSYGSYYHDQEDEQKKDDNDK